VCERTVHVLIGHMWLAVAVDVNVMCHAAASHLRNLQAAIFNLFKNDTAKATKQPLYCMVNASL